MGFSVVLVGYIGFFIYLNIQRETFFFKFLYYAKQIIYSFLGYTIVRLKWDFKKNRYVSVNLAFKYINPVIWKPYNNRISYLGK